MARVGIAQVDGKWPNLALAKIVTWRRSRGDDVDWFNPMFGADVVFASKIFRDTPDDPYLPPGTIRGGSGYDLTVALDAGVERYRPDWSLWPSWTRDMGYSTRGCVRRCPWCNVRAKDGDLHVVATFGDLSTGRDELVLLDANLTAAPIEHFRCLCEAAREARVRLNFSQGLDARLLTDEHAALIRATPTPREIHLAFDRVEDEAAVRSAVATFVRAGFPASRLMVYVLIGFDTTHEENLERVRIVDGLGADPFVMPFDRQNRYQKEFARWVNRGAFHRLSWEDRGAYHKLTRDEWKMRRVKP